MEIPISTYHEVEILLVEDNLDDAHMTIRALGKHNLANKLIHLIDGAEALDFLFCKGAYADRNAELLPKVILLDLKMPKVNGLEVLERLRADERTQAIPVVILTSSNEDPDIKKAYDIGANSYIVKPVGFEKFTQTVIELGWYWMVVNRLPQ